MRLKGISWIEQHFEKVFAGIFGVAAIGVLTWQFAGSANTVNVGPKKDVPLDQAYDDVIAAAQRTRGPIETTTIEPPVLPEGGNPIAAFEQKYRGPVAPAKELPIALGRGGSIGPAGPLKTALHAALAPLSIPAPTGLVPYAYMSTVHPQEASVPEVAAILPPQPPLDKASVTIEGRYNGKALRAALEQDPDGSGPIMPMQRGWWENMQLLAVELEREELMPDGKWGKATKVEAMPGRFSLLPDIAAGVRDAETLATLRTEAVDRAVEVRRPEYYDLWMGEEWLPPADQKSVDEAARAGAVDAKTRLTSQKRTLERQIETSRTKRADMGPRTGPAAGGREQPPDPRGGQGGGGGGRKGPGGGGRGPAGRESPGAEQRTYTDAQRDALDRKIEDLEKQLASVNKELGIAPTEAGVATGTTTAATKAEPSVLETEDLRLWAHDVKVERGKQYRYRMVLVFNNPLFGKGSVMVNEQAEWARTTLARSAASEWSEPIQVDSDSYWFITSASPPNAAQLNRSPDARAELFVFTMGYWRRGGATIEPGDPIVAEISVPDAAKIAAMAPAANVPPGAPAGAPPGVPGGKRPGGEPGRQNAPGGAAVPPRDEQAAIPVPADLPMINRRVATDAMLLGVGTASLASTAAGKQSTQAFVRTGDGGVLTVLPEGQKTLPNYLRVSRSADAARLASMPKEPEKRDDVPPPGRPGRDLPPPGGGAPPAPGPGGG